MLVATSADFALLRDGRPVASGAWADVVGARAYRPRGAGPGAVHLALALGDGSEFVGHEDAPGWDDFLDAAEAALPDLPSRRTWWPAVADPTAAGADVVLFGRGGR